MIDNFPMATTFDLRAKITVTSATQPLILNGLYF